MDYQIIVEYRPKLRACQFYFKKHFDEDTIEIKVQNNVLFISDFENKIEIKFPDTVKHITDSISGLKFSENSLCFRTRTNPSKTFGSFERELILQDKEESINAYKPKIKIENTVQIYCSNCLQAISKETSFDRVLPLPLSSGTEDFFCHFKLPTENLLSPRINDCLYGLYFYRVNPCLFETDIIGENIFECPRCSTWLGIVNSSYIQLWNSTTIINDIPPMASNNSAINDFIYVILEAISDKYSGIITNKIVLECATDFKDGRYIYEYLLLWIIENNLMLLTCKNITNKIELKEGIVCKVLYTYETSKNGIVNEWLDSPTINSVLISKNMLHKGLEYLKDMSNNIPEVYQNVNNMNVSYLGKLK
ncbi:hypothetical protein O3M35_005667 [Rhynocoris fuscipes]|uniref:E3 ubiquitin-protein ligase E3D n=1 Tax=Rhynocoris fuscipes TaxID=488301 RepID=A0AAW1DPY6_9HEMI